MDFATITDRSLQLRRVCLKKEIERLERLLAEIEDEQQRRWEDWARSKLSDDELYYEDEYEDGIG